MEKDLSPFETTVLGVLRMLPHYRSLRVIELGCGDGRLVEQLAGDGLPQPRGTTLESFGADYIRHRPYAPELKDRVDEGIDLNNALPYESESFDVVCSIEIIEHIECHSVFIAEIARVLRPGGYLVLTTPNLHRLASRLHFMLSGLHLTKAVFMSYDRTLDWGQYHHRPADFPTMHVLLWRNGLRIQRIKTLWIKPLSYLLLPFWFAFHLPMRLFVRKAISRHSSNIESWEVRARDDLMTWMVSRVLATSECFCLVARKTG